ncbi:ABC-three component system protein [Anatilimnocola floriformis]|uniref:ABC-three component system protein n=1 Tax=Anatilimnocola floriformis TaxID=2948575 RepID=UPI0020C26E24|nr:ABC-three component system protein [Anatilimnocola floriformis]
MKKKSAKKSSPKSQEPQSSKAKLVPMLEPSRPTPVRADQVSSGLSIPPLQRVKLFSPAEWEQFIQEWAHSLKSKYHTVMRCSGAGDMGRDVVGHTGKLSGKKPWDNYQCKHYDHALQPGDVWVELGKLIYYTFIGEFTIPRQYSFVCPYDVGTTLARLLENPDKLKAGVIENWDNHCRTRICGSEIKFTGKMKQYVERFPFEIVSFVPVLKLIEEHRATPWYVYRFGGGLPQRPTPQTPPDSCTALEIPYVAALLLAYSENLGETVEHALIAKWPTLETHFKLSRASFYSAESLRAFSRDHLPEKEFERLQGEIHNGVQETYLDSHADGYQKVRAVTKAAIDMQITDHALLPVLTPPDRRGICHQLANSGQLKWVNSDE